MENGLHGKAAVQMSEPRTLRCLLQNACGTRMSSWGDGWTVSHACGMQANCKLAHPLSVSFPSSPIPSLLSLKTEFGEKWIPWHVQSQLVIREPSVFGQTAHTKSKLSLLKKWEEKKVLKMKSAAFTPTHDRGMKIKVWWWLHLVTYTCDLQYVQF